MALEKWDFSPENSNVDTYALTEHLVCLDEQISVKPSILFVFPDRVVVRQTDVRVGGATVAACLVRNVTAGRDVLTGIRCDIIIIIVGHRGSVVRARD